jgi:glycosyltransferase involved in cell wall biosynthesis
MTDAPQPAPRPRFTVIAPMKDEADNVAALADEIAEACAPLAPFEAIFVNDGSSDGTAEAIAEARRRHPWLREVRHERSCGQSAAVLSGVRAARAPICCTLDGDGQNPPSEIPKLVEPLLNDPAGRIGLVAGQRRVGLDAHFFRAKGGVGFAHRHQPFGASRRRAARPPIRSVLSARRRSIRASKASTCNARIGSSATGNAAGAFILPATCRQSRQSLPACVRAHRP